MDITELLAFSAKQGASDLHLSAGLPPMIRVDGDVRRINLPPMDHKQVHELIYDIMNDKQRKDYEEFLALPLIHRRQHNLASPLAGVLDLADRVDLAVNLDTRWSTGGDKTI